MSDNKLPRETEKKTGAKLIKKLKNWGVIMYGNKIVKHISQFYVNVCAVFTEKESHFSNKPRKRETRTVAHKKKFVCKAEKKIVCRQRRGAKKKRERHFTRYASYRQQQQKRVVGLWKSLFPWE